MKYGIKLKNFDCISGIYDKRGMSALKRPKKEVLAEVSCEMISNYTKIGNVNSNIF